MRSWLKHLRGAVGTAMTWGVMWAIGTVVLGGVLRGLGVLPPLSLRGLVLIPAIRSGIAGLLAGGAFSAYMAVAYRRRSIAEINGPLFALTGVGAGALLMTLFYLVPVLAAGVTVRTAMWALPVALGGGLGGLTAGITIKMAKSVDRAAIPGSTAESSPLLEA